MLEADAQVRSARLARDLALVGAEAQRRYRAEKTRAGALDFESVAIHEILHGLGIQGFRQVTFPGYGTFPISYESTFDALTAFGSGGEVLSQPASTIRTLGLDAAGDIFVLPTHREFSPGGQLDPGVTPAQCTRQPRPR